MDKTLALVLTARICLGLHFNMNSLLTDWVFSFRSSAVFLVISANKFNLALYDGYF
ncbi:hypothetical protein [Maribacter sp. 2307UL18-2]|uniref:hypothetical protein n=1 Tax=Maribacter sp. 2307UL18-2 TaxID=3386274 RepID=UPI0039BD3166